MVSNLPTDEPAFREIVEDFVERLRNQLRQFQRAWREQDVQTLGRLGHWLKGSGGTAGFDRLSVLGARIERAARERLLDEARRALDELTALVPRLAPARAPQCSTEADGDVSRTAGTGGTGDV